jgi:hypothetical protein
MPSILKKNRVADLKTDCHTAANTAFCLLKYMNFNPGCYTVGPSFSRQGKYLFESYIDSVRQIIQKDNASLQVYMAQLITLFEMENFILSPEATKIFMLHCRSEDIVDYINVTLFVIQVMSLKIYLSNLSLTIRQVQKCQGKKMILNQKKSGWIRQEVVSLKQFSRYFNPEDRIRYLDLLNKDYSSHKDYEICHLEASLREFVFSLANSQRGKDRAQRLHWRDNLNSGSTISIADEISLQTLDIIAKINMYCHGKLDPSKREYVKVVSLKHLAFQLNQCVGCAKLLAEKLLKDPTFTRSYFSRSKAKAIAKQVIQLPSHPPKACCAGMNAAGTAATAA